MRACTVAITVCAGTLLLTVLTPVQGGDWPWRRKADPALINSPEQIARSIDHIQEKILDDGVIVVKRPDVWGQNRMSTYRNDFEANMKSALTDNTFQFNVAGRLFRSDQAALSSQTALGASLTALKPGGNATTNAINLDSSGIQAQRDTQAGIAQGLLPSSSPLIASAPGSFFLGGKPFQNIGQSAGQLGIEPTVYLDEKKRFLDHLNELRRVNIGDDVSDSAGYGLYLFRIPVSIQPGECTLKGHGALVTTTVRPDFGPTFLHDTFRSLVVADLVDQLSPVINEMIRSGASNLIDGFKQTLSDNRQKIPGLKATAATIAATQQQLVDDAVALIEPILCKNPARLALASAILDESVDNRQVVNAIDNASPETFEGLANTVALVAHLKLNDFQFTTNPRRIALPVTVMETVAETSRDSRNRLMTVQRSVAKTAMPPGLSLAARSGASSYQRLLESLKSLPASLPEGRKAMAERISAERKGLLENLNGAGLTDRQLMESMPAPANVPDGAPPAPPVPALPPPAFEPSNAAPVPSSGNPAPPAPASSKSARVRSMPTLRESVARVKSGPGSSQSEARPTMRKVPAAPRGLADSRLMKTILPADSPQLTRLTQLCGSLDSLKTAVRAIIDSSDNAADLASVLRTELFDKSGVTVSDPTALQPAADKLKAARDAIAQVETAMKAVADTQKQIAAVSGNIDKVVAASLPSTRNNNRVYPVAPSDFDDVFLKDQLFLIAGDVRKALITQTPKAGDIRTYLQHQIEAAYELLPYYDSHIGTVTVDVDQRTFATSGFSKLRDKDYPELVGSLPGDLRGDLNNPLAALCWAIAVDAGQLDKRLKEDMKATFGQGNIACPEVDGLIFYPHIPLPGAHETFCRYVTARWPMVAFALDPIVDQQNIDDAMSQRRDLQLALAFSFAAGRTSFNNLTRFSKRLERDAETIALNRTVSSFSHGSETFGWRFYPRYQNPPQERSNLQTATNLLWRGGPGRNYGMNNSKLEAGQRELTAVVVMPAFLERVKFEVVGNWFPLHDPDQMKTHTARMIAQGRQVTELRQSLAAAQECGHYRAGDLERLASRVDQVEAMLPLQTLTVSVPYESTAAGFQLFTPGSNSLVPELVGFEGAEAVNGTPAGASLAYTSLLIRAKRVSLHETRIVAGGIVLNNVGTGALAANNNVDTQATAEVVSREVFRVTIPSNVSPTVVNSLDETGNPTTKLYVEVYLSTPNGVSNRLLIPFNPPPKAQVAAPVASGYSLLDSSVMVSFKMQGTAPSQYAVYGNSASPSQIRIQLTENAGVIPNRLKVGFHFTPAIADAGGQGPVTVYANAVSVSPNTPGVYVIKDDTDPTKPQDFTNLVKQLVTLRQNDPSFLKLDATGKSSAANVSSSSIDVTPDFGLVVPPAVPTGLTALTKPMTNQLSIIYIPVQ